MFIGKTEIAVSGRVLRTARLRHEWCEFLENPSEVIAQLGEIGQVADLFTFVHEIGDARRRDSFHVKPVSLAVLSITTYKQWWDNLHFKVRNKIRKAQKSGVQVRPVELDDEFAKGVESIYNESPVRQGKKFWHYGKGWQRIKEELGTVPGPTCFFGAYHESELVGFMKLYRGAGVLRTVHIIAKLSHRDKPVMDLLIAQAVEICDREHRARLQYGSWSRGSLGAFKVKHGFARVDVPRYFAPLNWRGRLALKLGLHREIRDYLPEGWLDRLVAARNSLSALRSGLGKH